MYILDRNFIKIIIDRTYRKIQPAKSPALLVHTVKIYPEKPNFKIKTNKWHRVF